VATRRPFPRTYVFSLPVASPGLVLSATLRPGLQSKADVSSYGPSPFCFLLSVNYFPQRGFLFSPAGGPRAALFIFAVESRSRSSISRTRVKFWLGGSFFLTCVFSLCSIYLLPSNPRFKLFTPRRSDLLTFRPFSVSSTPKLSFSCLRYWELVSSYYPFFQPDAIFPLMLKSEQGTLLPPISLLLCRCFGTESKEPFFLFFLFSSFSPLLSPRLLFQQWIAALRSSPQRPPSRSSSIQFSAPSLPSLLFFKI